MINVITQPLVFCDVETTGGNPRRHRITEIAAIRYENGKEISRINTLVNPHQDIPFNIQIITNINNIMTDSAPDFNEISDKISEIFDGATLVAHHSRFDFSFIQAEMERAGHRFNPKQICTAKLSRRLYPHHRGHGLSNIIERFSFVCKSRHRALGDTEILVHFSKQLEKDFTKENILNAVQNIKGSFTPPPLSLIHI